MCTERLRIFSNDFKNQTKIYVFHYNYFTEKTKIIFYRPENIENSSTNNFNNNFKLTQNNSTNS